MRIRSIRICALVAVACAVDGGEGVGEAEDLVRAVKAALDETAHD